MNSNKLKPLLSKIEFYSNEAKEGNYHNPYDVNNELTLMFDEISNDLNEDEKISYEEIIGEIVLLFYDM